MRALMFDIYVFSDGRQNSVHHILYIFAFGLHCALKYSELATLVYSLFY